jgi:hypothetical protein
MNTKTEIKWTKTHGGTEVLRRCMWTGKPTRTVTAPSRYVATGPVTGNEYEIQQVGSKWHSRTVGKPGTIISDSLRNAKDHAMWAEQDAVQA